MTATTIIEDDVYVDEGPRFSWAAALAGAVVATAVTFFLLTLGAGVGLSLVNPSGTTAQGAAHAVTLGAAYFVAAQAMGFAVGGHLAGRLISTPVEVMRRDSHFCAHGLVVWAVSVVATAALVAIGAMVATGSAINAGAIVAASPTATTRANSAASSDTDYWVDTLFRAPAGQTAAAAPAPEAAPTDGNLAPNNVVTTNTVTTVTPARNIAAAKAEVRRILVMSAAQGGDLSVEDHDQAARLISENTNVPMADASARVDDAQARIHQREVQTAEMARQAAIYFNMWVAISLLFGAVVASVAALAVKWEDERELEREGVVPMGMQPAGVR